MILRLLATFLFFLASNSVAADSDERAIHQTYKAWLEATNRKDIDEWATFLASDPYFVPADSSPLATTEEVIDYYARSFSDPLFALDCTQGVRGRFRSTRYGLVSWQLHCDFHRA